MDIKKATAVKVPVRLLNSTTGAPVTGLTFNIVTVYISKAAGASVHKTLVLSDWLEVDATNMPGAYMLNFSAGDTDTVGFLMFSVAAAGADTYVSTYYVVNGLTDDIYRFTAGRYKIDKVANTFTVYDVDGTTVLKTFTVKDSTGAPNATSIYERA